MLKKRSDKKIKTVLITGGAGFIGTHLVEKLLTKYRIVIYDNFRRNALQFTNLQTNPYLTLIKGDVLDTKMLTSAFKDVDVVIHLAAIAGVSSYEKDPLKTLEIDAWGTYNVLKLAVEFGISQVILFSSSEVYGPQADSVNEDSSTVQGPATQSRWSYGVGKLVGDHFGLAFAKMCKLPVTIVRPFNIYGPRQVGEGAIQLFIKAALSDKPLVIKGDGKQMRAWCYIDDLIKGFEKIILNPIAFNQILNIGNPNTKINVISLANLIVQLTNSKSKFTFVPQLFAEIYARSPDITKAQKILNFSPKTSLDAGLNKTIEWFRNYDKR